MGSAKPSHLPGMSIPVTWCKGKHGLLRTDGLHEYECDICRKHMQSTPRMSCRRCDFDTCMPCVTKGVRFECMCKHPERPILFVVVVQGVHCMSTCSSLAVYEYTLDGSASTTQVSFKLSEEFQRLQDAFATDLTFTDGSHIQVWSSGSSWLCAVSQPTSLDQQEVGHIRIHDLYDGALLKCIYCKCLRGFTAAGERIWVKSDDGLVLFHADDIHVFSSPEPSVSQLACNDDAVIAFHCNRPGLRSWNTYALLGRPLWKGTEQTLPECPALTRHHAGGWWLRVRAAAHAICIKCIQPYMSWSPMFHWSLDAHPAAAIIVGIHYRRD